MISSKLIAEKIGAIFITSAINFSGFFSYIHIGTTSTPPNYLKMADFPSITGKPAVAPISPKPKIAVPLVIMAAQLFFRVS